MRSGSWKCAFKQVTYIAFAKSSVRNCGTPEGIGSYRDLATRARSYVGASGGRPLGRRCQRNARACAAPPYRAVMRRCYCGAEQRNLMTPLNRTKLLATGMAYSFAIPLWLHPGFLETVVSLGAFPEGERQ
jgi:hypothetical protein